MAAAILPARLAAGNPAARRVAVSNRVQVLVENVIAAQRGLTRAMIQRDDECRKMALEERDTAVERLYEHVAQLDMERARASGERLRSARDVTQLQLVIAEIEIHHPMTVQRAFASARLPLAKDDRISQTFQLRLNTAIDRGLASRNGDEITITYAGVTALLRADERREEIETLRAENFELERRLRAGAEAPDHSTTTSAAGAGV